MFIVNIEESGFKVGSGFFNKLYAIFVILMSIEAHWENQYNCYILLWPQITLQINN